MIRRGVGFTPMETRRGVIVDVAVLADELGYETVAVPEAWGLDSTIVLAEIAMRTRQIRPMSAILSAWSRTPAAIAMNTATLADLSDGRYILGLGASTAALTEGLHNVSFDRPATRLEQVAADVRSLLAGDRMTLDPTVDARPLRLGVPARPTQSIVLAAAGPRTRRFAAEHADGWVPALLTRDRYGAQIEEALDIRSTAAGEADEFTVYGGPMVAVHPDADRARAIVSSLIGWYLVAMGKMYSRHVADQGFQDEVAAVLAANPSPRPDTCTVPPEAGELLAQLGAFGTADGIGEQLAAWDGAADVNVVLLAPGQPREVLLETVRAAAPS